MAIQLPEISQRITLDDRELQEGGRRLGGLGKAIAGGLAVAGAAAGAVAVKGVQAASGVDAGLREVVTLFGETGDAADATLAELSSGVRELSGEVGIAQGEIIPALYSAISAGVPRDNVFDFMETAAKASIAGVTDIDTAVDGLSSILNAFQLDADATEDVAASMFAAVQGGKTNFEELSQSIFQVAPAAAGAGVEFSEVNAAIATLTASGVPTNVATTRIRAAIDALADSSSVTGEKFAELTGKSFPEFTAAGGTLREALMVLAEDAGPQASAAIDALADSGSEVASVFEERTGQAFDEFLEGGGDVIDALDVVSDVTGYTGDSIADMFGSVEAAGAAMLLTANDAEVFGQEVDRQAEALGDSAATIDGAFGVMDDGVGRSMERVKVAANTALVDVGNVLLPSVAKAAEAIGPAISNAATSFGTAAAWVQANSETITTWVRRIATVLAVVLGPSLIRSAALATWSFGVKIAQAVAAGAVYVAQGYRMIASLAMVGARSVASAARVVGALTTIAVTYARLAVQAAVNGARMALSWTVGIVVPAARAAATMAATAARVVAGWVLMGAQALAQAARMAAAWLIALGPIGIVIAVVVGLVALIVANWETVRDTTVRVFTAVGEFLSNLWATVRDAVVGFVTGLRDRVVSAWTNLRDRVVALVTNLRDRVVGFVTNLRDRAIAIVTALVTAYVRAWTRLISTVVGAVSSFVSRIVGFFTSIRDRVSSAAQAARDRVVEAFARLVSGARERVSDLLSAVRELPGRIRSALSNAGTMLTRIGRDIIRGLIDGVKAMAGRAVDAVRGVVDDAIGGAKRLLGISSPSKVFAAIGRDTGEGLAIGLDQASDTVQAAADGMMPDVDAQVDTTVTATARGVQAGLDTLQRQLAALADRPIDATFDLGEGITARHRVEQRQRDRRRARKAGAR